jgi:hypothetical protein
MGPRTRPAAPGLLRLATAPAAPGAGEPDLSKQTQAEADRKSSGCVTCHTKTDSPSMHTATTVKLGCVDCHGGRVEVRLPEGAIAASPEYEEAKKQAHILPRFPDVWTNAANPPRTYTLLNRESLEFIQFVLMG